MFVKMHIYTFSIHIMTPKITEEFFFLFSSFMRCNFGFSTEDSRRRQGKENKIESFLEWFDPLRGKEIFNE